MQFENTRMRRALEQERRDWWVRAVDQCGN